MVNPDVAGWFSDLQVIRDQAVIGERPPYGQPAFILNDHHFGEILDTIAFSRSISIWDRDLPRHPRHFGFVQSGVYIWFESQDQVNIPIYVGQSRDIFVRLYGHYWTPSGEIYQFIGHQLSSGKGLNRCATCGNMKVTCYSQWIMKAAYICNCTPRYWVRLMVCDPSTLLSIEREFIEFFNPILNIKYTDWYE